MSTGRVFTYQFPICCTELRRPWPGPHYANIKGYWQIRPLCRDCRRGLHVDRQDYHHPSMSFRPERLSKKEERRCNEAYREKRCEGVRYHLAKLHKVLRSSVPATS